MELIIKGNERRIKQLAKELEVRVKKEGSTLSIKEDSKTKEVKEPKVVKPRVKKSK